MFLFDNTKALKRSLIQMQDNICKIPVYFPRLKHDGNNNDNYKNTDNSSNSNNNYTIMTLRMKIIPVSIISSL